MKKTITLASLLISSMSFAQLPVITAANQMPVAGDTIFYSDASSFGFDPDGSGGAIDVTWDYSSLSPTASVNFFYRAVAGTPEAANFPTATIAMGNSSVAGYEYFENTVSTISRWGYTGSVQSLYYNPSFVRYSFPITPGVTQSALYSGFMSPLGVGEDSVTISMGNYTAVPDSYGTLSLPAAIFGGSPEVFDSVIRVHVTETFTINAWIGGAPLNLGNIADDYYFWFDEQTQDPILIYGTTNDGNGGITTVLRYQSAISGTGTGGSGASLSENNNSSLSLFPNPTENTFVLQMQTTVDEVIITDMNGRTMKSFGNQSVYDVSDLKAGMYMVHVYTHGTQLVKRLMIR